MRIKLALKLMMSWTPRTSVMPWTIFLMPVYQTCGGKSPGSHPHWAFGSQSFWRETNSSIAGCLKEDPKVFG